MAVCGGTGGVSLMSRGESGYENRDKGGSKAIECFEGNYGEFVLHIGHH